VSGWPNELFEPYAAYVYNVFQSQNEVPLWFEPFLHSAQRRWKRWVPAQVRCAVRCSSCDHELAQPAYLSAPGAHGMDGCVSLFHWMQATLDVDFAWLIAVRDL
jgi:hypothetical protein